MRECRISSTCGRMPTLCSNKVGGRNYRKKYVDTLYMDGFGESRNFGSLDTSYRLTITSGRRIPKWNQPHHPIITRLGILKKIPPPIIWAGRETSLVIPPTPIERRAITSALTMYSCIVSRSPFNMRYADQHLPRLNI